MMHATRDRHECISLRETLRRAVLTFRCQPENTSERNVLCYLTLKKTKCEIKLFGTMHELVGYSCNEEFSDRQRHDAYNGSLSDLMLKPSTVIHSRVP
jgi:hypothetical protein